MVNQNSKRLLSASGEVFDWDERLACESIQLDGNCALDQLPSGWRDAARLLVNFPFSADGRGFSLAAFFTQQNAQGQLIATGFINPDQVSLLFQCGFDAVLIDATQIESYGWDAWVAALQPVVNLTYARTAHSATRSIWALRG